MSGFQSAILVVDDNPDIRFITQTILSRAGYTTDTASSYAELKHSLNQKSYSIIILDVRLPDANGFDICKKIKADKLTSSIFLIMISGEETDSSSKASGIESGADYYLVKPFDRRELLAIVSSAYRIKSAENQALTYRDHLAKLLNQKSEQLMIAESQYHQVFESSSDGLIIVNDSNMVVNINPASISHFEFESNKIIGYLLQDLLPTKELEIIQTMIKDSTLFKQSAMLLHASKNGCKELEIQVSPLIKDQSQTLYIINSRDLTEQRYTEHLIRDSEERFRQMAESIQEVFFLLDQNNDILLYVSPFAKTIFGEKPKTNYDTVEFFLKFFHTDDISNCKFSNKNKRNNIYINEEFRIRKPDQSIRWLRLRSFPVYNAENQPYRVAGVISDVTEFKDAQEQTRQREKQLVQADKLASLGVLVAGVAHEINNPNNFILPNSRIVSQGWNDIEPILKNHFAHHGDFKLAGLPYSQAKDEIQSIIDGITKGAERIKKIVDSLKNYVRDTRCGYDEPVDVNEAIKNALFLLSYLIKKSTNNCILDLESNLPILKGNSQQLEQVVINLITNACQALRTCKDSIHIHTTYSKETKSIQIIISDQGEGIPQEYLEKVFDPFFSTKSERGGTGLGLAISQKIIRAHGGTLQLKSQLGQGTTATISLPIHDLS